MNTRALTRLGGLVLYFLLASSLMPVYARSSGDPRTNGIIFSAIGLFFGVLAFFHGFKDLRIKRRMEDIPVSTLRAMAPGQVEVSGKAVDWATMTAPLTGEPCVYYEFKIEQKVGSGKNSHWETLLSGKTYEEPFYIDDGTSCVRVLPQGADIILDDDFHLETGIFNDVPPLIDAYMTSRGLSCLGFFGFEKTLRFYERRLHPGETVFILGTCQEEGSSPDHPPSPNYMDKVYLGFRKGDFFILSDESRDKLESSFGLKSFFGIFGGIALVGVSLYFLIKLLRIG
jgi:hypothetical protein